VMAGFGAPNPRGPAEDAARAVSCALEMRKELVALNARFAARKIPQIGMRIGIATGKLVAGSLGGALRVEYTVIGDIVNVASRLEGVAKENPEVPQEVLTDSCRILIAGPFVDKPPAGLSTYELVKDQFELRRMARIEREGLKGMQKHIEIYGVVGPLNGRSDAVEGVSLRSELKPTER